MQTCDAGLKLPHQNPSSQLRESDHSSGGLAKSRMAFDLEARGRWEAQKSVVRESWEAQKFWAVLFRSHEQPGGNGISFHK